MKNRKTTVTIGIPAYNEEKNIRFLLQDVLDQKQKKFKIRKIIVYSDASTDKTLDQVKKIKASCIKIVKGRIRKGQAHAQNQIIRKTNSDILVLLNADVIIKDRLFLEKLVYPIISKKADLTSARVQELYPVTFIQRLLDLSMKFKKTIFESYKRGDNIYTCHGRARAFSKRLYRAIFFKHSVGEDAYSYLFCKFHRFSYSFVKGAQVFYTLPANWRDHEKQSVRFYHSQQYLSQQFDKNFVRSEYYLPRPLVFKSILNFFSAEPLILMYLLIAGVLKIKSMLKKQFMNVWDISLSSKVARKTI